VGASTINILLHLGQVVLPFIQDSPSL
jgi:hypothetical protein